MAFFLKFFKCFSFLLIFYLIEICLFWFGRATFAALFYANYDIRNTLVGVCRFSQSAQLTVSKLFRQNSRVFDVSHYHIQTLLEEPPTLFQLFYTRISSSSAISASNYPPSFQNPHPKSNLQTCSFPTFSLSLSRKHKNTSLDPAFGILCPVCRIRST